MSTSSISGIDSASRMVAWAIETYSPTLAIGTSFQKEGMVLIDMAVRLDPSIRVFTLDTGRLPESTYGMIETVRRQYGIDVELVFPAAEEVEGMVRLHGPNLFYAQPEFRALCCQVRKVRPLERKLATLKAWITGLRKSQSAERENIPQVDESGTAVKINPLADWDAEQVEEYIRAHDVPVHPLYALGYTSIGCAPCTRPVEPGEAERAGRWWWEGEGAKECGIHLTPDGRARRRVDVLMEELLHA